MLVRLEQTAVAAFGDEQLNLIWRMDVTVSLVWCAEKTKYEKSRAVQPRDERAIHPLRGDHGEQGVKRRLRWVLKSHGLGHQLGEHDLRDGEREQHDHSGCRS